MFFTSWLFQAWDGDKFICMDSYSPENCLIYSFGIRLNHQHRRTHSIWDWFQYDVGIWGYNGSTEVQGIFVKKTSRQGFSQTPVPSQNCKTTLFNVERCTLMIQPLATLLNVAAIYPFKKLVLLQIGQWWFLVHIILYCQSLIKVSMNSKFQGWCKENGYFKEPNCRK